MIGTLIVGRYLVESEIGQGGFGTVYQALDTQNNSIIAIKQLSQDISNADNIERFKREGEALSELNHPNIVKMLDAVQQDNSHYLVMEYVSGGDLEQLLTRGQMDITHILNLAIDLADALTRAHRLDITHRDLKPANILLAQDGTLRLTDFGVAHFGKKQQVTQTGTAVGTLNYLSPEALQGEPTDALSDIWSFGVILFEMVAGERPFRGDVVSEIIMSLLEGSIPDLEVLRPDAPIALVDLIYRMLERDIYMRIGSVRHVGAELEDILQGRSQTLQSRRFTPPKPTIGVPINHNLPIQSTSFIGRKPELAELDRLLWDRTKRLLTIVAPGGMGKTRLALEIGQRHLDTFTNGVYFVDLTSLSDVDNIPTAIVEAMGSVTPDGEPNPKQWLLDFLTNKTALLILDNYEHLIEAASLPRDILNVAPNVQILVTSRIRLDQAGEVILHLSGMDFPQWETPQDALDYAAVKLFVSSGARVLPSFELTPNNLDYVVRICRLVGGMPLGIVLASSWLSMLSPEEIATEITNSITFLEATSDTIPARQRSMGVILDYSWNLLTSDEQSVLCRLSIFRDGCTREAAQNVTGASLRQLMNLVNKSLLRRDMNTGRYMLHELVRQYAYSQLEVLGNIDTIRNQHSQYYLQFLAEREDDLHGNRQLLATDEITADFENIIDAWRWGCQRRDNDSIAKAVEALGTWLWFSSRWNSGNYLLYEAQQAFTPQGDDIPSRAWRMVTLRYNVGDRMDMALQNDLLQFAIDADEKREVGMVYILNGHTYYNKKIWAESAQNFKASLPYFEATQDTHHWGDALFGLISCYQNLGRNDEANIYQQQLDTLNIQSDSVRTKTNLLYQRYFNAFREGNLDDTSHFMQDALTYCEQNAIVDHYTIIACDVALFHDILINGQFDTAQQRLDTIDEMQPSAPIDFLNIPYMYTLAKVFIICLSTIKDDDVEEARQEAQDIVGKFNKYFIPSIANAPLATIECHLGNYDLVQTLTFDFLRDALASKIVPVCLMALVYAPIILCYRHKQYTQAAEILSLVSTHPSSMNG